MFSCELSGTGEGTTYVDSVLHIGVHYIDAEGSVFSFELSVTGEGTTYVDCVAHWCALYRCRRVSV